MFLFKSARASCCQTFCSHASHKYVCVTGQILVAHVGETFPWWQWRVAQPCVTRSAGALHVCTLHLWSTSSDKNTFGVKRKLEAEIRHPAPIHIHSVKLSAFYQWDCSRHTTSLVSCLSLPDHSALAILLITAKISFDLATSWVLTFTPCETVHSLSLFGGAVSAIQGLNLKAAMLSPSGSPLVSVGQPVNMSFALWLHSLPETFLLACTYVMSRSPSALLIIAAYFLIIF